MRNELLWIQALTLILETGNEFTAESFEELNESQQTAYRRDHGDSGERIYRVLYFEPSAVRSEDGTRVTMELSIVTESERQSVLDMVAEIHRITSHLPAKHTSFADRLQFVRSQFRIRIK